MGLLILNSHKKILNSISSFIYKISMLPESCVLPAFYLKINIILSCEKSEFLNKTTKCGNTMSDR